MNSMEERPIIAITMGDPVGIGPEIIPKALAESTVYEACRPLAGFATAFIVFPAVLDEPRKG